MDNEYIDVKKGITLNDALGYRYCDTIVAASALTLSTKLKLKTVCKKHYADHLATIGVDNSNTYMINFLTGKAKEYLQGISRSQVTKHGRTKEVDMALLESVAYKTDGNNSTLKNITHRYNKRMKGVSVSKSTIYLRLKRRLNFSYRKIRIRNSKVKKLKYRWKYYCTMQGIWMPLEKVTSWFGWMKARSTIVMQKLSHGRRRTARHMCIMIRVG